MTQHIKKLSAIALMVSGTALLTSCAEAQGSADLKLGKEVYEETCVFCHGDKGKGEIPGAPDFTKADGVLSQDEDVLIAHITDGYESPGSVMAMPAKGGNPDLTEEEVKAVLDYLQGTFGPK